MEDMQKSIEQLSQLFSQRMEAFESEYSKSPKVAGSSTGLPQDYSTFREFVLCALRSLQDQIDYMDKKIDNNEMRSRRKILLFHGLPESKQDNTAVVISKVVKESFKMSGFSEGDIARCHRMGRAVSQKPRPILVKFRDMSVRDKIWLAKSSLKGSGYTLSEFLTRPRHLTFLAAREQYGVSKCWTGKGSVFFLDAAGNRHKVTCLKELHNIGQPTETRPAGNHVKDQAVAKKKAISKKERSTASSYVKK